MLQRLGPLGRAGLKCPALSLSTGMHGLPEATQNLPHHGALVALRMHLQTLLQEPAQPQGQMTLMGWGEMLNTEDTELLMKPDSGACQQPDQHIPSPCVCMLSSDST